MAVEPRRGLEGVLPGTLNNRATGKASGPDNPRRSPEMRRREKSSDFRTNRRLRVRRPARHLCRYSDLTLPSAALTGHPSVRHDRPQIRPPVFGTIPDGDDRKRLVCPDCGYVAYDNPEARGRRGRHGRRPGAVVPAGHQPPQGFLDAAGRLYGTCTKRPRKARAAKPWEEARARIAIDSLLAVYTIPHIGQVQLIYRATLTKPGFAAGPESEEVRLFDWADIPWSELAFPSVRWALEHFRRQGVGPDGFPADRQPTRHHRLCRFCGVAIPMSERANCPGSKG